MNLRKQSKKRSKVVEPAQEAPLGTPKGTTSAQIQARPASNPLGKRGPKAKFSFKRHILPPLAGLLVMAGVLAALNEQYLVAQYHYRFAKNPTVQLASAGPRSSSTNSGPSKTNTYAAPNPERGPYLLLPSIGVEAPIVFEPSYAEWKVQLALREGVDHYGTTANPGQPGNMVILGHSSGVAWAPGKYKFVFTMLDKLKQNQPIYVDYHGTRYTYKVTEMFVVPPTDGTVLQPTTTPTLTLITCTPVGTSKNRLIVKAELVSPLPAGGTTGAGTSTNGQTQNDMLPAQLPAS